MSANRSWDSRRKRIYEIVNVGASKDFTSRAYDFLNTFIIVVNLASNVIYTFQGAREAYEELLMAIEAVTAAFFAVDYALRVWTARFLYPDRTEPKALVKYIFSFTGLVDLLSFLPYYLPVFFPTGAVAFRMFRVVRIFRLFRLNRYYDALNVITEVISSKRQQLLSSVFIILVLMLASSLCMYSLEHEAQPEVFTNAFSGLWWAVSTLLTVGYGDIYPITPMGRLFSIVITFVGVGMVAIPTGIISAGFVDQYSRAKRLTEYADEKELRFVKVTLTREDPWTGRPIRDLDISRQTVIVLVRRGEKALIPSGDLVLKEGDIVVLYTRSHIDNTGSAEL